MALAQKKSSFTTEYHDILGDKVKILRVKQSGGVWQFRMWIADEGKYLRKQLKTRDFEAASLNYSPG